MLATLQARDFQPLNNCLCKLTIAEDCEIEIELVQITEKPNAAMPFDDANNRIPFSLIFKTPQEHAFEGVYCHFHHPTLGILENLLINRILPLNPRDNTAWYQIIFA